MTTLIQFQDGHTHLLGLGGLIDMLAPCVLSVETKQSAQDHFVETASEVYGLADNFIRKRLDAGIVNARFDDQDKTDAMTLAIYKEPGLTVIIIHDLHGNERPYRVIHNRTEHVLDAPRYLVRMDAQLAFDAIVRPRLDARFATNLVGSTIMLSDTSNSTSNNISDQS